MDLLIINFLCHYTAVSLDLDGPERPMNNKVTFLLGEKNDIWTRIFNKNPLM